jgi:hypothetical protein
MLRSQAGEAFAVKCKNLPSDDADMSDKTDSVYRPDPPLPHHPKAIFVFDRWPNE